MSRALLLDYNGTLSLDEPLLYAIYAAIFEEQGRPLSHARYVAELAGLAERTLIARWLGERPDLDALVAERVRRYVALAGDGHTIPPAARSAVRQAASSSRVAVVSGAARVEIESALAGAGLARAVSAIVADGDVPRGKPDPACYLLALERLGCEAADAVAFEDTDHGIEAAAAAGIRVIAVRGTLPEDRLAGADLVVDALTPELVRRELSAR